MNLYPAVRPLIFRFSPETAHHLTISMLRLAGETLPGRLMVRMLFSSSQPGPEVRAFGLTFRNPIGMAAGYDKDGLGWRGLAELGFGHIELGTVTPRPQPGNPGPRLFRLVNEEAVINRMGFPNRGAAFLASQMRAKRPAGMVLGVSIGKNKDTALEEAAGDYIDMLRTLAPVADYLAINVSSPNTPGLRKLQSYRSLFDLLSTLAQERSQAQATLKKRLPLLVKLAPDLSPAELDDALNAIVDTGMDGIIATNTTVQRDGLKSPLAGEIGGLSGAPLRQMSTDLVRRIVSRTRGRLPVIASGGVMTPQDAREKMDAGALMVQLFTGLIYNGPSLVQETLNSGLLSQRQPALRPVEMPGAAVEQRPM